MIREQWRPCFMGYYEVSSLGRVRRAVSGCATHTGRVLRQRVDRAGYLTVSLKATAQGLGGGVTWSVHRLVASAFIGPCPPGLQVNHRDGNKLKNDPANLEYVTASENRRHAFATGLQSPARGTRNGHAKLTEDQVREIRRRRAEGVPIKRVASDFGVVKSIVSRITHRLIWRHVA